MKYLIGRLFINNKLSKKIFLLIMPFHNKCTYIFIYIRFLLAMHQNLYHTLTIIMYLYCEYFSLLGYLERKKIGCSKCI